MIKFSIPSPKDVFDVAVGAAVGFFVGGGPAGAIAGGLAVASSKYQQSELEKEQKRQQKKIDRAVDDAKGFQLVTEGEEVHLPLVYGRARIGGNRVFHKVSSNYTFANPHASGHAILSSGDATESITINTSVVPTTISVLWYHRSSTTRTSAKGETTTYPGGDYDFNDRGKGSLTNKTKVLTGGNPLVRISPTSNLTITVLAGIEGSTGIRVGRKVKATHFPFIYYDTWNVQDGNGVSDVVAPGNFNYEVVSYNNGTGALVLRPWSTEIPKGTRVPSLGSSKTGTKNEFLFMAQTLCISGIEGIYAAFVNDKDIRSPDFDATARTHVYESGGTADPLFTANDSSGSTSLYPEAAWAFQAFKLDRDEPQYSGIPSTQYFVEGMKVETIVGAPSHVLSGTKTYTNNPAYCLLDYLLSPYGLNITVDKINLKSFYDTAQIYDSKDMEVNSSKLPPAEGTLWLASGRTRVLKRYECNLTLDTERDVRDNIKNILDTMPNASFFWSSGEYKLLDKYPLVWDIAVQYEIGDIVQYDSGTDIDLWRAKTQNTGVTPVVGVDWENGPDENLVAAYITDDDILLDSDVAVGWPTLSSRYNHCEVSFLNESKDFEKSTVDWPPKYTGSVYSTYLSEDNGITLDITEDGVGVTNEHHARALAEETVRKSRHNNLLTLSVSAELVYLEPGDHVNLSSAELQIPYELFKVLSVEGTNADNLELQLEKYDARTLAWNAPDDEVIVPRNVYNGPVPQVTGLAFATLYSEIGIAGILTWNPVILNNLQRYDIYYANETALGVTILTEWFHIGSSVTNRFSVPALDVFELNNNYVLTVVPRTVGGVIAPQENWALNSSWPLIDFQAIPIPSLQNSVVTLQIFVYAKVDRVDEQIPLGGFYDFENAVTTPPAGFYASSAEALLASGDPTDPGDLYFSTTLSILNYPHVNTDPLVWDNLQLFNPERNVKNVTVFHRRPSAGAVPSVPTGGTFDFTTDTPTVPTGNVTWYLEDDLPDGIGIVYQTSTLFSRMGNYGLNTNTPTWSLPILTNATGAQRTKLTLYQWASTPPTLAAGAQTTYDWLDGSHSNPVNLGSWSLILLTNPGGVGVKLWLAELNIESPPTALTHLADWDGGSASIYTTDAGNVPGGKGTEVAIYKWESSTPSAPVTDSTYTWATSILSVIPATWFVEPQTPATGQTLYKITVKLQEEVSVATSTVFWSNYSILAVGSAGETGAGGSTGTSGLSARRCYSKESTGFNPTGGAVVETGDVLPDAVPPPPWSSTGTWSYSSNFTLASNEAIFQSDGFYDPAANQVTWQVPYISSFKVGALSAISVNTGALSVNDTLTMALGAVLKSAGVTSVSELDGDGYWLSAITGDAEFRIGNSTKYIKYDGGEITLVNTALRLNEDGLRVGVDTGQRIEISSATNEVIGYGLDNVENFRLGHDTGVGTIFSVGRTDHANIVAIHAEADGTLGVAVEGISSGAASGGYFTNDSATGVGLSAENTNLDGGTAAFMETQDSDESYALNLTVANSGSGGGVPLRLAPNVNDGPPVGTYLNGSIAPDMNGELWYLKGGPTQSNPVWSKIPSGARSVGQFELKSALAYQSLNVKSDDSSSLLVTGGTWTLNVYSSGYDDDNWSRKISRNPYELSYRWRNSGGGTRTFLLLSRYIQASPPYNLGDGDVPLFIYFLIDNSTKKIQGHSIATDPHWAYHGPTNIATAAIKSDTLGKLRMPTWKAEGKDPVEAIKSGSSKKIRDMVKSISESRYEMVDATHKLKNSDMNIVPHPFQGENLEGKSVLLLDPVSDVTLELAEYLHAINDTTDFNSETDPLNLFKKGYLKFGNEELNRKGPRACKIVSVNWTKTAQ